MTRPAYGSEPERIEVSEDLVAIRLNRTYSLRVPFRRSATDIIRTVPTAFYDAGSRTWSVSAIKHEELERAMRRMDEAMGHRAMEPAPAPQEAPKKSQKVLVPLSEGHVVGQVLTDRKRPVTVESLGDVFPGPARLAQWGKRDLVGKPVRYVYHHPSTEAEIEAWNRKAAPLPEPDLIERPEPDGLPEP